MKRAGALFTLAAGIACSSAPPKPPPSDLPAARVTPIADDAEHYLVVELEDVGHAIVLPGKPDLDRPGPWPEVDVSREYGDVMVATRASSWPELPDPTLRERRFTVFDDLGNSCTNKISGVYQVAVYCSGGIYDDAVAEYDSSSDIRALLPGASTYLVAAIECPGIYARTGQGKSPRFVTGSGDPKIENNYATVLESARASDTDGLKDPDQLVVETQSLYDTGTKTYYVAVTARYRGDAIDDPEFGEDQGLVEELNVYEATVEQIAAGESTEIASVDAPVELVAIGDVDGDDGIDVFFSGGCVVGGVVGSTFDVTVGNKP